MFRYLEYLSKTIHPFLINNILLKARAHIRYQIIFFFHSCKNETPNKSTEAQLRNVKNSGNSKLLNLVINVFNVIMINDIENICPFA